MRALLEAQMPFLTDAQKAQFLTYYEMLIDWNTRMNLTAVTDAEAVVQKHFLDSLAAEPLLPHGARVIDVGTGAGFPGVPLAILRPDVKLTLLDSLNKRIAFLSAVCGALSIPAACVHMRAEDAGRDNRYRASFDIALSRAVSALPVLAELTIPLLKVGGVSIAYKGDAANELVSAGRALSLLQASAEVREIPCAWGRRSLVLLKKNGKTPQAYPRKAGTPEKAPLLSF